MIDKVLNTPLYTLNSFMTEVPISYRNQSTDLLYKSMDWFLHDGDLRHKRVTDKNLM